MYQAYQPESAGQRPVPGRLDVDALRHPTEGSRFALACVASTAVVAVAAFVLLSTGHVLEVVAAIVVVTVVILIAVVTWMLMRIQLLANAVHVAAATLPDVDEVVQEVRERLAYDRRLDVFVVNKTSRSLGEGSPPVTVIGFFGVRFILVEGDVIGDLSDQRQRGQFVFLLATCVGALKARHTTWSPYLAILQGMVLPKLVGVFVAPWHRATVYTGDRIALACCGDLDVSLHAFYRDLVGKDIVAHLQDGGFVAQALRARRRAILRLSQLLHSTPHATNRYLELLSFAAVREPAGYHAFRAGAAPASGELDSVLADLGRRRPLPGAQGIAVLASLLLLAGGLVAGLTVGETAAARFAYEIFGGTPEPEPEPQPEPVPLPGPVSPAPVETPTPIETTADPTADFIAGLPSDLRETCVPGTAASDDPAELVVHCTPLGAAMPETVSYFVYPGRTALQASFDDYVGEMETGDCETGSDHRTTWTSDEIPQGPLACYTARSGKATILWGNETAAVLVIAQDESLDLDELYTWWTTHASVA
jgi:hypothetical protein